MRQLRHSAWLLATVLLLGGCAPKKLEHFKFYSVSGGQRPVAPGFQYKGQFDQSQFKAANADQLTHFGIAVDKNGEGIDDRDHHLTWYKLSGIAAEAGVYKVWLKHQFGDKDFLIGSPKALLVPAEKSPHPAPTGLSHFVCYEVLFPRVSIDRTVTLKDQLAADPVTTTVKAADFFCIPVAKKHGEKNFKIEKVKGPKNHLLIYQLDPHVSYPDSINKRVRDQFVQGNVLREFRSQYLAVPAQKTNWERYEGPIPPPQ